VSVQHGDYNFSTEIIESGIYTVVYGVSTAERNKIASLPGIREFIYRKWDESVDFECNKELFYESVKNVLEGMKFEVINDTKEEDDDAGEDNEECEEEKSDDEE
jgi:nuclear transport factor 2 (NTF2) superfamily protein